MEVPWLPTVLNMLEDIPYWCAIVKDLIKDVLVDWVLNGLLLLHLTLWYHMDKGFLLQFVKQWQG